MTAGKRQKNTKRFRVNPNNVNQRPRSLVRNEGNDNMDTRFEEIMLEALCEIYLEVGAEKPMGTHLKRAGRLIDRADNLLKAREEQQP